MSDTLVLVAGATGPIGRAVATELAERGHTVAVHHRASATIAERLAAGLGPGHPVVAGDLLEPGAAGRVVAEAESAAGRPLAGVVNCAWPPGRSLALADPEGADLLEPALDGLRAHLALCRASAASLRSSAGAMVFVGGALATRLHPTLGYYSIGKAAATTATLTYALEEGRYGVRATVIAPGRVDVGDGDLAESDPAYASLDEIGVRRRALPSLPTPGDVARLAAFLVGPDGSGVTGQVLGVAGGGPL